MPAIVHEMSSASKNSYAPYKNSSREKTSKPSRPFLDFTNKPLLAVRGSEPASPCSLPPAPKINTVNLPLYSPICGLFADSTHLCGHSPSYFPPIPTLLEKPAPGPFQVVRHLRTGSYGSAVAANDLCTARRVCLKAIEKIRVRTKEHELQALRNELAAYKMIANTRSNPYIMDCHGVFQDETLVFFAMDQLPTDLHSLLGEKLSPNRIKRWIAQMTIGISALHEMGIIHRDIKPENILVDRHDNIRISDFGTALICNEPVVRCKIYSTELVGTRQYMAPEMIKHKSYNGSVDYWALGCTVYDLIVGDILFQDHDKLREYLKWDEQTKGMSFLDHKAKLGANEYDLISGLIHKRARSRYSIVDLRDHPYFVDKRGRNIFLEVELQSSKQSSHATQPWQEDLYSDITSITYYATADPYAYHDSPDFFHFGWINPRGMWGDK